MAVELKSIIGADSELFTSAHERLRDTVGDLVAAARASGEVRGDIEPFDLLRAVSGFCLACDASDDGEQVRRLVDLLMDGMRYAD